MQPEIECVVRSGDVLGEAPLWDERSARLWWIDVRRPVIQCYDPATGKHFAVRLSSEMTVGSIALREAGDFALATSDLVDVKVIAIDETWSGLKLMVRRSAR